eukprot:55274-Eustigmatos_ZCMA.PRE.1
MAVVRRVHEQVYQSSFIVEGLCLRVSASVYTQGRHALISAPATNNTYTGLLSSTSHSSLRGHARALTWNTDLHTSRSILKGFLGEVSPMYTQGRPTQWSRATRDVQRRNVSG